MKRRKSTCSAEQRSACSAAGQGSGCRRPPLQESRYPRGALTRNSPTERCSAPQFTVHSSPANAACTRGRRSGRGLRRGGHGWPPAGESARKADRDGKQTPAGTTLHPKPVNQLWLWLLALALPWLAHHSHGQEPRIALRSIRATGRRVDGSSDTTKKGRTLVRPFHCTHAPGAGTCRRAFLVTLPCPGWPRLQQRAWRLPGRRGSGTTARPRYRPTRTTAECRSGCSARGSPRATRC